MAIETATQIPPLTRAQRRARHAYACASQVPEGEQKEYKIAVNDLGANILRSGLAAAMAALERRRDRAAVKRLLNDLAAAGIPGLEGTGDALPGMVRGLPLEGYMLATKEMLQVVTWLKRAVQATF